MKWKINMLKRIKLTLDEILKTRFKEELIPPWILKKINLARLMEEEENCI
jgi:hypothetical protein